VLISLLVAHHAALGSGRLSGAIWPIPPTQVAHYTAELTGLSIILWASRLMRWRIALLLAVPSFGFLLLTHTRTALAAAGIGGLVAFVSLFTIRRRVRRAFTAFILAIAFIGVPLSPLITSFLTRGQSPAQLSTLTGRTNFWGYVLAEHRTTFQTIFGDGISNGSINGQYFNGNLTAQSVDGLPIDSSWVEDYQDEGIAGDVLTGLMFVVLLVMAAFAPRGPRRAIALFLLIYCLFASITEDGAGIASQYAMDMTVAASLIVPEAVRRVRRRRPQPLRPQLDPPLPWA
jgi:O-antigen ligase